MECRVPLSPPVPVAHAAVQPGSHFSGLWPRYPQGAAVVLYQTMRLVVCRLYIILFTKCYFGWHIIESSFCLIRASVSGGRGEEIRLSLRCSGFRLELLEALSCLSPLNRSLWCSDNGLSQTTCGPDSKYSLNSTVTLCISLLSCC